MKELSIEQKAKAYDDRLEKAQKWYDINTNKGYRSIFEDIFPELKESEDEKIRREIKQFIRSRSMHIVQSKVESWLYWLEKQGNKDMGISNTTKQKLKDNLDNALEKETPESWNEFLEKQGEQKTDNELKFEIGDLITNGILVGKIDEIHEWGYHAYFGDHYADVPDVENWHKWTIQDAKDGDMLCCESGWTCIFKTLVNDETFSSYCFMDNTKWFCETGCECHTLNKEFMKAYNGEIKPATKEQRDLLFQKMREAGYEWDAEKKELKKIEQKQVIDYPDNLPKDNWEFIHEFVNKFGRIPKDEDELNALIQYVLKRQTSTEWSEEDEDILNTIINHFKVDIECTDEDDMVRWLKSLKDRVQPQPKQEWSEEDEKILDFIVFHLQHAGGIMYQKEINWLKSLRSQKQWKPSDEQMEALHYVTNFDYGGYKAMLVSLYEQLKKLKEE